MIPEKRKQTRWLKQVQSCEVSAWNPDPECGIGRKNQEPSYLFHGGKQVIELKGTKSKEFLWEEYWQGRTYTKEELQKTA